MKIFKNISISEKKVIEIKEELTSLNAKTKNEVTKIKINEIISIISEVLEKRPSILFFPKKIVYFGVGLFRVFRLNSLTSSFNKLTENYRVSNEKIKKELGLDEMPISSRNGLKTTINSFL